MGDIGEQQEMSAAVAEVDQTGLGQMMRSGTTSVDLMNQYQAAIEKAMADRGYSIRRHADARRRMTAGYGGTSVNTTVNITSPLGTPSQISQAVSAALARTRCGGRARHDPDHLTIAMGISGNQKALMYALGNLARGGATRGGYTSMLPYISIGGVVYPNAHGGRTCWSRI